MIGVLERDKSTTLTAPQPPVLIRDPQRDLYSGRPVVGIENTAESVRRKQLDDGARQLDRGRIRETEKGSVRDEVKLAPDGGIDARMIMPVNIGPDG